MALDEQDRSARARHSNAPDRGDTCIDCHKGVAHELPEEPEAIDEGTAQTQADMAADAQTKKE
jgi:cytochrome c-type protein NapC